MKQNAPYVKMYDENGILINPITKSNPYLFSPHVGFLKMFNRALDSRSRVWEPVRSRFFKGLTPVKI
jgi:hypothetical protein